MKDLFKLSDIKFIAFAGLIMIAQWFIMGGKPESSVSEEYLIERLEEKERQVENREEYIHELNEIIEDRDEKLNELYNDTIRIHNYYNRGILPRSTRDSLREIYNPR